MVHAFVTSCRGCNAAATHTTPVPLEPNLMPEGPWRELHADFKGPIGGNYYLHIVIDQFSKYPEVDILKSTSFKKLRPVLERIFATHGIPESVTSDNGPPYPSNEMKNYALEKGFRLRPVSPEDPQSNGFAESFVKLMCKMLHTCIADGKNPKDEFHNYLLQYRATPHSTTGVSPAELLFGRKVHTKLPQINVKEETEEIKEIRRNHDQKKLKQKHYFDKRHRAHEKIVNPGDQVLVKQRKSTTKTPYDPKPYTVLEVNGNQLKLSRDDGSNRIRDKNQVRLLKERPAKLVPSWESDNHSSATDYMSFEIEGNFANTGIADNTESESEDVTDSISEIDVDPEVDEVEEHEAELYDINEDEEARMNDLLQRAQSNQQEFQVNEPVRITRSSGLRLEWNSAMNEKEVVLEKKDN